MLQGLQELMVPLGLLVLPERPGRPGVQVAQVQPEVQVGPGLPDQ